MFPESSLPVVRRLWPVFQKASKTRGPDAKLLLAVAWVESGLAADLISPLGAEGLMQMMPSTAATIAGRLGIAKWDLHDPAVAVDFAAWYLQQQIERFSLPRLAVAAYHAGPAAVARAGNQIPDRFASYAHNVMVTWDWLRQNLDGVLSQPVDPPAVGWRLVAPPDDWQHPLPVSTECLPVLEALAERLSLAFHKDEPVLKVYVGLPRRAVDPPDKKGGLILPVPGATKAANGAYQGDSGLDIIVPVGSPVVVAGAGLVLYSEFGHTPWNIPPDTPGSVLIELDTPFQYGRKSFKYTWYTHLSRLHLDVPDGSRVHPHVKQGDYLGAVGRGNRVPHLHFGVVADRAQTDFVSPFQLAAYFGWADSRGAR